MIFERFERFIADNVFDLAGILYCDLGIYVEHFEHLRKHPASGPHLPGPQQRI